MPQNRPIRRGQLITPWGIGSMINFPGDETLMVCGLDAWDNIYKEARDGLNEFIIKEERLERRLGVRHSINGKSSICPFPQIAINRTGISHGRLLS